MRNPDSLHLFQRHRMYVERHRYILRDKNLFEAGCFYLFPLLPLELQNMIWVLSLTPRLVEVQYYSVDAQEDNIGANHIYRGFDPSWNIQFYSIAPLPSALFVSQASRDAVINRYPLCFASETAPACIHFNFELDTLFLDQYFQAVGLRFMQHLTAAENQGIRRLALAEEMLDNREIYKVEKDEMQTFRTMLLTLPNVKELTITTYVWEAFIEGNDGEPREFDEDMLNDLKDMLNDLKLTYGWNASRWPELHEEFPEDIHDDEDFDIKEAPEIDALWMPPRVRAIINQHAPKRAWICRRHGPPVSV